VENQSLHFSRWQEDPPELMGLVVKRLEKRWEGQA
jgi:hypothetical protein